MKLFSKSEYFGITKKLNIEERPKVERPVYQTSK